MRSCNWVAVDVREGSSDPICSYSNWTLFSSRIPLVRARFWRCCLNATIPGKELGKNPCQKMSWFGPGWHNKCEISWITTKLQGGLVLLVYGAHVLPCLDIMCYDNGCNYLVWGMCLKLCAPLGSWLESGCGSLAFERQVPAWLDWQVSDPRKVLSFRVLVG